jgi:hypothetical protein
MVWQFLHGILLSPALSWKGTWASRKFVCFGADIIWLTKFITVLKDCLDTWFMV